MVSPWHSVAHACFTVNCAWQRDSLLSSPLPPGNSSDLPTSFCFASALSPTTPPVLFSSPEDCFVCWEFIFPAWIFTILFSWTDRIQSKNTPLSSIVKGFSFEHVILLFCSSGDQRDAGSPRVGQFFQFWTLEKWDLLEFVAAFDLCRRVALTWLGITACGRRPVS